MKLRRTGQTIASNTEWMRSPAENARGLLKFDRAPSSYAAIFVLSFFGVLPIVHTFGMRFPIDVVFCDSKQRIVFLERDVSPGRFVIPWKFLLGGCRYLVEFSAAETSQLLVGDELDWGSV